MSSFVGWDEPTGKARTGGAGGGSGMFLKLESGKTYRVRLVGNAVQYFQHWEPVICRSPGVDPKTNTVLDPLMQMSKPDGTPYLPKERYAIWVLDRLDGNKLKIMDFPGVLYDRFKAWKADFNQAPGDVNGPDWKIELQARGGNKRNTQYIAERLDRTPFTTEEIERIQKGLTINGAQISLRDHMANLRRANTPEEIRNLLATKSDPTGPTGANKSVVVTGTTEASFDKPAQTQAPAAQAAPAAPAANQAPAAPKGFEF